MVILVYTQKLLETNEVFKVLTVMVLSRFCITKITSPSQYLFQTINPLLDYYLESFSVIHSRISTPQILQLTDLSTILTLSLFISSINSVMSLIFSLPHSDYFVNKWKCLSTKKFNSLSFFFLSEAIGETRNLINSKALPSPYLHPDCSSNVNFLQ